MSLFRKYYEELFVNSSDNRDLLPQNQDIITKLLNANGAVGIFGLYEEPDYPIYFTSGFALTAIGYDYEEMFRVAEGKFINLIYEKDQQSFLEHLKEDTLESLDFRMLHSSGRNVWVNFYGKRSVSADNRPILIASIRVVEDAKKREGELLEALTKSYDHIIYVDLNQGRYRVIRGEEQEPNGQLHGTVKELQELLDRYGKECISSGNFSFSEVLQELDFSSRSEKKGGNYQTTFLALLDGEEKWIQFQVFYGGAMKLDTGHFILTFRVVDEEKKKELETNRMLSISLAKAAEASNAKNQFLSRMSHDLRTPLNGITGMLEMINKNRDDQEMVDECLKKIAISCDTLQSLVQDVLDLNKLENGKIELSEEHLNLHTLLTEDLKKFAGRAERSGFTYRTDVESLQHANVLGSRDHILQIFEYILDNALKYNKPGGSVTLSGRELSRNKQMATYEFVVEDTGLGMSEEFLQRIFEPFEQEDGKARTQYMETGLGMPIVKKLVEQMHGIVAVESKKGVGTRVKVQLPLQLVRETEPEIKPEDIDFSGVNVLLVEDNELNMEIAKFLLENVGMKVTCAANGQKAVEAFAASGAGEFQVVLMDIMMPVMDGLEATRVIRQMERPDAKTVKIIALSANVMDADVKKGRLAGMDEYQAKPVQTDRLLGVIAKCTGSPFKEENF